MFRWTGSAIFSGDDLLRPWRCDDWQYPILLTVVYHTKYNFTRLQYVCPTRTLSMGTRWGLVLSASRPGRFNPSMYCTGAWENTRTGFDALEDRNISSRRESNPDSLVTQHVTQLTIFTELPLNTICGPPAIREVLVEQQWHKLRLVFEQEVIKVWGSNLTKGASDCSETSLPIN